MHVTSFRGHKERQQKAQEDSHLLAEIWFQSKHLLMLSNYHYPGNLIPARQSSHSRSLRSGWDDNFVKGTKLHTQQLLAVEIYPLPKQNRHPDGAKRAEGPAVVFSLVLTAARGKNLSAPKQNCHPDRSEA
jgi:hypothetical protein